MFVPAVKPSKCSKIRRRRKKKKGRKVVFQGQNTPNKAKLNQNPSKAVEKKVSRSFLPSLIIHLALGLWEVLLFWCLPFHKLHTPHFKPALRGRGSMWAIHTLKEECFKIGEPAELQIGHIGDAIMTQMKHFQASHQWFQAAGGPSIP